VKAGLASLLAGKFTLLRNVLHGEAHSLFKKVNNLCTGKTATKLVYPNIIFSI
jgi:hypothetical protein